jgi:hypothetical protein
MKMDFFVPKDNVKGHKRCFLAFGCQRQGPKHHERFISPLKQISKLFELSFEANLKVVEEFHQSSGETTGRVKTEFGTGYFYANPRISNILCMVLVKENIPTLLLTDLLHIMQKKIGKEGAPTEIQRIID